MANKDSSTTVDTKAQYDRIASVYDWLEFPMEKLTFRKWRKLIWSHVQGPNLLEVGVGTGKNIPYYPAGLEITGIDLSEKMLKRAKLRARNDSEETQPSLVQMDVQDLDFPENHFDTTLTTFVFCSVTNPIVGLKEINRVTKPDGEVFLLEHVRPEEKFLGKVFDIFNPMTVRLLGVNINRKTTENVKESGLEINWVNNLTRANVVKLISAKPSS